MRFFRPRPFLCLRDILFFLPFVMCTGCNPQKKEGDSSSTAPVSQKTSGENQWLNRDEKPFLRTGKLFGDLVLFSNNGGSTEAKPETKRPEKNHSSVFSSTTWAASSRSLTQKAPGMQTAVLKDIFSALWQAALLSVKDYALELMDREAGVLQTKWITKMSKNSQKSVFERHQIRITINHLAEKKSPLNFCVSVIKERKVNDLWIHVQDSSCALLSEHLKKVILEKIDGPGS